MTKRILVVDDSAFMRKILSEQINRIDGFEVVATAHDGEASLLKIETFKPDAVTLDVEMPGMNGLETLKKIKEKWDIPVFMLSSLQGTDITIQALELGATDFIEKPEQLRQNAAAFHQELASRLQAVFLPEGESLIPPQPMSNNTLPRKMEAIAIGASTGGPRALLKVVESFSADLAIPVFIVQHMPKGFTTSFAKRLDEHANVPVVEAKHGETIEAGKIYLAPGDYHMTLSKDTIVLSQDDKEHGVRPAVDRLFTSAAEKYGPALLSVIMTGMGKDGTQGMKVIKEKGGSTIAQNRESCVVYGMPKSAIDAGLIDVCVDLEGIAELLNDVAKVSQ